MADRLVAKGWERKMLDEAIREGARYSPSRDSIITAPIAGGFDDEGEGEYASR